MSNSIGDVARASLADCEWAYIAVDEGDSIVVRTEFLWPDNGGISLRIIAAGDGWYEVDDEGEAFNALFMTGLDDEKYKVVELMDEIVLPHGLGLYRRDSVIGCRVRGDELWRGVVWVLTAAIEVAGLVTPWRAGILKVEEREVAV